MTWTWPKGRLAEVLPRRTGRGRLGAVPVPPPLDVEGSRNLFTAEQCLGEVVIRSSGAPVPMGTLDDAAASELIRDLEEVVR